MAPRASTASTDLVARVAALIPAPMTELGADLAAWAAFDELVDEAARLVADSLGPASTLELEGLLTAPIGVDPVCQRLVLQTLAALRSGHRA